MKEVGVHAGAAPARLSWSSDDQPGYSRRRAGRGFIYRDEAGLTIRDSSTLARIRALAIPPAWTEVWICRSPRGHIQAVGRDAQGRKQYRYHADWIRHAAVNKFHRLADFGRRLPRLKRDIDNDLSRRGPKREKVLATVVSLLELSLIRVGNAEYRRANRSFGLTTLQKRHMQLDGAAVCFVFKGKSGVEQNVSLRSRRLAPILRSLRDLPGQTLFQYRDETGDLVPIGSSDVNAYIRAAMGDAFSAKDFRTWAATSSAARMLRDAEPPRSDSDGRRKIAACLKGVARSLGNTPSVCRQSYVHPAVLDLFRRGEMAKVLPAGETASFDRMLIRFLAGEGTTRPAID